VVQLVLQELVVHQDQLEQADHRVLQELVVHQELQVPLDQQELQELAEHQEHQEHLEHQGQVAQQDLLEQAVNLDLQ